MEHSLVGVGFKNHLWVQIQKHKSKVSGGVSRDTISYIEDCIAQLRPINLSLRLVRSILFDPRSLSQVCLLSHCGDGLALSDYQRLKTQFVQAYGFQHLVTWNNLLKVGDPIYEVTNPI